MYEIKPGDVRNLSKILRVAKLKNTFRWGYKYKEYVPAKKFFGITISKAIPPGYYEHLHFRNDPKLVIRSKAVYDGRFIRIWTDPAHVSSWNYGEDLEFSTTEGANKFYEACLQNSKCIFAE